MIETIATRIARHHNFHKHTSLAYKCNNPGKLTRLTNPPAYGAIKTTYVQDNGKILYYFQHKKDGWKALHKKIESAIKKGWDLKEFLQYNYQYTQEYKALFPDFSFLEPLKNYIHE